MRHVVTINYFMQILSIIVSQCILAMLKYMRASIICTIQCLKSWLECYVCTRVKTMFNASLKHNPSYANHIQCASFHVLCQYLLFVNVMRNRLSLKRFSSCDSSHDLEVVKNWNLQCGRKYICFSIKFSRCIMPIPSGTTQGCFYRNIVFEKGLRSLFEQTRQKICMVYCLYNST